MFARRAVLSVLACLLIGSLAGLRPSLAQDPAEGNRLQALIQELKGQLDRGERERLIDPWFLRDLRQVLRAYEWPWTTRLFSDDFSGRGPQPGPPWKVTSGEVLIDWRFGLRSVVEPGPAPAPAPAPAEEQPRASETESVRQLFGQFLEQALEPKERTEPSGGATAPAPGAAPAFATAFAPVAITNAFAVRLEMTSRPVEGLTQGRFEFGPYQGENAAAGYRLAYVPGGSPGLELVGLSARGTTATIEVHDQALALEDGQAHVFEWTRDSAGRMAVKLDGASVMSVTDRRFNEPFDGFAVVNSGGDYALRSLTIDGTE